MPSTFGSAFCLCNCMDSGPRVTGLETKNSHGESALKRVMSRFGLNIFDNFVAAD